MTREEYRLRPIFGTDMSLPASVLTEQVRNKLVEARNIISDIYRGYGWEDRFDNVEGLINCGLTTLFTIKREIEENEIASDDRRYGPSYRFGVRGIGSDDCPGCFVCGQGGGLMTNIAAFVSSKEDGEIVVGFFDGRARLDFRSNEPKWIQVKVGVCPLHEANLEKLRELCLVHAVIRKSTVEESKKG